METWKAILSLDSKYEASSTGKIRRAVASRGAIAGRILAQRPLVAGYLLVCTQFRGKTTTRLVHRLIAEAFLGNADGREVNHVDSNKANNHASNLEYVTRSENLLHAARTTGAYRGERNHRAKITPDIVREIRRMHADGMGYKKLAAHFGLTWGLVRSVACRVTWNHIS